MINNDKNLFHKNARETYFEILYKSLLTTHFTGQTYSIINYSSNASDPQGQPCPPPLQPVPAQALLLKGNPCTLIGLSMALTNVM